MEAPTRPEAKPEIPVTEEVEQTVRERLATIERDKKTAEPLDKVKRSILQHLTAR